MVEYTQTVNSLGFNEYPDTVEVLLNKADWGSFLNRLRMGVVLTFALTEAQHEHYIKYCVDELENGNEVFLIRPAWLNLGFDFKVCIEGWDNSAHPSPSHPEIYSDIYWKREYDSAEAVESLCEAAINIYEGDSPDAVMEKYSDEFKFTTGRIPEALIRALPWLFIEQDIRYWNYDARDKTIGTIQDIYDGVELEDLSIYSDDEDENRLQPLDEIEDTDLSL